MSRYWDFSLPSAEVHPTGVSKANTALQLLLVGTSMAAPVLPEAWMGVLEAWSAMEGLQYVGSLFRDEEMLMYGISAGTLLHLRLSGLGRVMCTRRMRLRS
jgi:hypothetical protein